MLKFAETSERIAATTKKLEKTALLADYLKSVPVDEAATAAVFFSGQPFPMWEEATLQVGGRMLWQIIAEISGGEKVLRSPPTATRAGARSIPTPARSTPWPRPPATWR
jgi:hypothetical protein